MKTLFIIRGLPGSGKTSSALRMARNTGGFAVASDDFLMENGEYVYSDERVIEAHRRCYMAVRGAMEAGRSHVMVHNTFVLGKYVTPYRELADELGYRLEIPVCRGDYGSVHGVPPETIGRMRAQWQEAV